MAYNFMGILDFTDNTQSAPTNVARHCGYAPLSLSWLVDSGKLSLKFSSLSNDLDKYTLEKAS